MSAPDVDGARGGDQVEDEFPTVGMVGGGQLARMTAQAAIPLGVRLKVLAQRPDDSAAKVVADTEIGEHHDLEALRAFAKDVDVLTFDHEHVPTDHLHVLEQEGVAVRPGRRFHQAMSNAT